MAPPTTYRLPHEQLGELMLPARRAGRAFEEWWDEAMQTGEAIVMVTDADPPAGAVRWPTDPRERKAWQLAIAETREAWRRSFERARPTSGDVAFVFLMDAIGMPIHAPVPQAALLAA